MEELEECFVFVALQYSESSLVRSEFMVDNHVHGFRHPGALLSYQSLADPAEQVPMSVAVEVNNIAIISEEHLLLEFIFDLDRVLQVLEVVNGLCVVLTQFIKHELCSIVFLLCQFFNVLISMCGSIYSLASAEILFQWNVESFEERLEVSVFGALRETCDFGSLYLVLVYDPVFCKLNTHLLLLSSGALALPHIHLIVKLKDVGIVVVEVLPCQWSLHHFFSLHFSRRI